jgi:hypothetical protein
VSSQSIAGALKRCGNNREHNGPELRLEDFEKWGDRAESSWYCPRSAGRSGTRHPSDPEREQTTTHQASLIAGTRIAMIALSRIPCADCIGSGLPMKVLVVIVLITIYINKNLY